MRQISCSGYDTAPFYADRSRVRENTHVLTILNCNKLLMDVNVNVNGFWQKNVNNSNNNNNKFTNNYEKDFTVTFTMRSYQTLFFCLAQSDYPLFPLLRAPLSAALAHV